MAQCCSGYEGTPPDCQGTLAVHIRIATCIARYVCVCDKCATVKPVIQDTWHLHNPHTYGPRINAVLSYKLKN